MSRFTPRTKRGKIVAGIIGFAVAFGGGAFAAVLFFSTAPISGGVSSTGFTALWTDGSATVDASDGMTCTANVNSSTHTLVVNASQAFPTGHCDISGQVVIDSNTQPGVVTGLTLTVPPSYTATLVHGCGATVNGATPVTIRLAMKADGTPGSSGSFAPTDGVNIAPQSTSPTLDCTP